MKAEVEVVCGGRISIACNLIWFCQQPGGLAEISRGLRRTAQRGDDTPRSGRSGRDLGRVAENLASRWDAVAFPRRPRVSRPRALHPRLISRIAPRCLEFDKSPGVGIGKINSL